MSRPQQIWVRKGVPTDGELAPQDAKPPKLTPYGLGRHVCADPVGQHARSSGGVSTAQCHYVRAHLVDHSEADPGALWQALGEVLRARHE